MTDTKIQEKLDWGIIEGDYFKYPAVSRSRLLECLKSLAHFRDYKSKTPTEAMKLGSAIHCRILEPHLFRKDFAVFEKPFPESTMRKKENKEALDAFEQSGKTILSKEDMDNVNGMFKAIKEGTSKMAKMAKYLLFETEGKNEEGIFFKHDCGETCKVKLDRVVTSTKKIIPIDFKKTRDASPKGFEKACTSYDYPVQAAFYEEGVRKAYGHLGKEIAPMHFIMQEDTAPYRIGIYTLAEIDIIEIQQWIDFQLCEIANSRKTGVWREYESDTNTGIHSGDNFSIEMPPYYIKKFNI